MLKCRMFKVIQIHIELTLLFIRMKRTRMRDEVCDVWGGRFIAPHCYLLGREEQERTVKCVMLTAIDLCTDTYL